MESEARRMARKLSPHAEAVCRFYLSAGRKNGRYWLVGDIQNNPGRSLYVRLAGPELGPGAAGKWNDTATGEHGDLLDIIQASAGLSHFKDVLDEARCFLSEPKHVARPIPPRLHRGTSEAARRLFLASKPLVGTLGEKYLRGRSITCSLDLDALRFHPNCYHKAHEGSATTCWPAIVAKATNAQRVMTGLLRGWLNPDGSCKAPLETPRRAMGDILGSAIWLGPLTPVCAVGEGLETMLSIRSLMPGMCAAAATSASHLAAIEIPNGVVRLYIAADNDRPGRIAAERLALRCLDAPFEIRMLVAPIDDWNTTLQVMGMEAAAAMIRPHLHPDDRPYL